MSGTYNIIISVECSRGAEEQLRDILVDITNEFVEENDGFICLNGSSIVPDDNLINMLKK
jgi:hypothetical protein